MRLSLLAIMLDEEAYVDRWLAGVRRLSGIFDQVVVVDGGSTDRTVDPLRASGIVSEVLVNPFPGDFAAQRNLGAERCAGEWIMEVDADETMSVPLYAGLPAITADADRATIDRVGIPRVNFLDGQLVASPGVEGLDYQYRLHRKHCFWRGRVHEEVFGSGNRTELKIEEGHFLLHRKTAARHATRNLYYDTLKVPA